MRGTKAKRLRREANAEAHRQTMSYRPLRGMAPAAAPHDIYTKMKREQSRGGQ